MGQGASAGGLMHHLQPIPICKDTQGQQCHWDPVLYLAVMETENGLSQLNREQGN